MRYGWNKLKKEYLLSECKSINEFLKSKNIAYSGNARKQTKGWTEERENQQQVKSNKVVEKVIEKQSEKEAEQIVDLKSIANKLAIKLAQATEELSQQNVKKKIKTKTVKYDYVVQKPSEEVSEETEEIQKSEGIIDRFGAKQLSSALKDLNEVLYDKKEAKEETLEKLDEVLKNIGGVI